MGLEKGKEITHFLLFMTPKYTFHEDGLGINVAEKLSLPPGKPPSKIP